MIFRLLITLLLIYLAPVYAALENVIDDPIKKGSNKSKKQQKYSTSGEITENSKVYVSINGIEKDYLENAKAYLDIDNDDGSLIINPTYTKYLARQGVSQIKQSLQPFGYYKANVDMDFENKDGDLYVNYEVNLGDGLVIDKLNIQVNGDAKNDPDIIEVLEDHNLELGNLLVQSNYTDLKSDIKGVAATNGYFDGVFNTSSIVLDESLTKATINLVYDSGIRYRFDTPVITQDFLKDSVFDRYKIIRSGDLFSTKLIAEMQRNLYNSEYVKQIDIETNYNKENKTVAIEFKLTRQKRKKYSIALGFGTDTGVRLRYDYTWRWVNKSGHSINTDVFLSQNLIDLGADYRIPARMPATDYFRFFTRYTDDNTGDIDSKTYSFGAGYHDKIGDVEREMGLKWQQEKFRLGFDNGDVGTLTPYLRLVYKKTDDILNTSNGLSLIGYLTGASEDILSDISFLQMIGEVKYINRIKKHKFTFLAGLGKTYSDDFHSLPPQFRFFTGGDRTIRGYSFEDIGDRDGSGDVIGGDKLYYTSAEYEYFFKPDRAIAAFVDAGDAYSDDSKIKFGAGLGFHYYSPIGPIKLDVAHGFEEPGDSVRLHFTIGVDL